MYLYFKNFVKNSCILLISIALTILFLELITRLFVKESNKFIDFSIEQSTIYEPSDITGYLPEPHANLLINSYGMFDKEYPLNKDKSTYRIIVLGDSRTAENLYPTYLEEHLNKDRPLNYNFEVWNLSVPGFNIRQYANYLKYMGIRYKPDMVIIGLGLDDFYVWTPVVYKSSMGLVVYNDRTNRFFPRKILINSFLFYHSHLYRFLIVRLPTLFLNYTKGLNSKEIIRQEGLSYLKIIKNVTYNKRIPLICVVFPYLKSLDEYSKELKESYECYKDILEVLDILNIDLHNYHGYSLNNMKYMQSYNDFIHPNEEGNKIIERAVYDYITSTFLK